MKNRVTASQQVTQTIRNNQLFCNTKDEQPSIQFIVTPFHFRGGGGGGSSASYTYILLSTNYFFFYLITLLPINGVTHSRVK